MLGYFFCPVSGCVAAGRRPDFFLQWSCIGKLLSGICWLYFFGRHNSCLWFMPSKIHASGTECSILHEQTKSEIIYLFNKPKWINKYSEINSQHCSMRVHPLISARSKIRSMLMSVDMSCCFILGSVITVCLREESNYHVNLTDGGVTSSTWRKKSHLRTDATHTLSINQGKLCVCVSICCYC